ncbi:MAG TPA: hypothetical protein VFM55_26870 [Micromonosporaceae bacterium]|nr:hypothetical protein [Micromonosporaceae bacterium]
MSAPVDRRLLDAGLAVTTAQLVDLWAAHCPAHTPVPTTCPGCTHSYGDGPLCPTARIIRPLLRRRRFEVNQKNLSRALTYNQQADLTGKRLSTQTATVLRPARPNPTHPPVTTEQSGLFPVTPDMRRTPTGGTP